MSTISIENNKKTQRTINNPLVNIEDVTIASGLHYINWIFAAKTKLKERETKLMKLRLDICQNIIISSIQQFTIENAAVFNKQHDPPVHIHVKRMKKENSKAYCSVIDNTINNIINKYSESITQQLANWKGYKPKTTNIATFRGYFKGSRGWLDVRKVGTITKHILTPIADMINQF
eukprot:479680_1